MCFNADMNSKTSHALVLRCPKHPRRGLDYFCSQTELNQIDKNARVGELRVHLEKEVPRGDKKRTLLNKLEPLFADLEIFSDDTKPLQVTKLVVIYRIII